MRQDVSSRFLVSLYKLKKIPRSLFHYLKWHFGSRFKWIYLKRPFPEASYPVSILLNSQSIRQNQMTLDTCQHFTFSNQFDREKWLSLGTCSSSIVQLTEKKRPPFLNYYFYYFRCREISSCSILVSLLCKSQRPCAIHLSSFLSVVSSFIPFSLQASTSMCLIKALRWVCFLLVEYTVSFCVLCMWYWVMERAVYFFHATQCV